MAPFRTLKTSIVKMESKFDGIIRIYTENGDIYDTKKEPDTFPIKTGSKIEIVMSYDLDTSGIDDIETGIYSGQFVYGLFKKYDQIYPNSFIYKVDQDYFYASSGGLLSKIKFEKEDDNDIKKFISQGQYFNIFFKVLDN